jgi:predicted RNase H-like nuclease (RuvC/YqgF family)
MQTDEEYLASSEIEKLMEENRILRNRLNELEKENANLLMEIDAWQCGKEDKFYRGEWPA